MKKRCKSAYGIPENPLTTLNLNALNNDKAMAEANSGWWNPAISGLNTLLGASLSAFGNSNNSDDPNNTKSNSATVESAYGIPVEVEGGETAQLPNGKMVAFNGPSHENGGIDVNLPDGTEVFSDRIRIKGKTFAERAAVRDSKKRRAERAVRRNGDILSIKTADRVNSLIEAEAEADKAFQDGVRQLAQMIYNTNGSGSPEIEMATGGTIGELSGNSYSGLGDLKGLADIIFSSSNTKNQDNTKGSNNGKVSKNSDKSRKKFKDAIKNLRSTTELGDLIGATGNLYQGFRPYLNTLRQRTGDTANVNSWLGYNQEAIKANEVARDLVASLFDLQVNNNETNRLNTLNSLRNNLRGANSLSAASIASQQIKDDADAKAYAELQKQYADNYARLSQLLSDRDSKVMAGEERKLENDVRDRDAFYTALGTDYRDIGKAITSIGSLLNNTKKNKDTLDILSSSSPFYGLDENGRVVPRYVSDDNNNMILNPSLRKTSRAFGGRISKKRR